MNREYISIEDYLRKSINTDNKEHVLETFFIKRNFVPGSPEEKAMLDSFSFIAAAMSLLIHLSMSKGSVSEPEKLSIIKQLAFQLHQRSNEYQNFKDEYGKKELEIITNLYAKLIHEYENNQMHIDKQIELINKVYGNNLQKRFFIIRLCFYIAYADKSLNTIEKELILDLAEKLDVEVIEVKRIEKEVKIELEIY